jgi:hypothetical protein
MASRTQTQSHDIQTQRSGMLPECATTLATLVEQMRQVTVNLGHITEIVLGNGKQGLQKKTDDNGHALEAIIKLLDEMRDSKKAEDERLKQEALNRRNDIRKWWLGIAGTIILSVIAIGQAVATQAALKAMELIVKK